MTKVVMRRHLAGLLPVDAAGAEVLRKIQAGRDVLVEVKTARNPRQHRLFFALLGLLVDNTDQFASVELALQAVKLGLGEADPIVNAATGEVVYVLRSIAWESMDGTRFGRLFDDAVRLIADRWLGTDHEELRQNVYLMVDGPAAASLGRRVA